MEKIKKTIAVLSIGAITALGISACDPTDDPSDTTQGTQATTTTMPEDTTTTTDATGS